MLLGNHAARGTCHGRVQYGYSAPDTHDGFERAAMDQWDGVTGSCRDSVRGLVRVHDGFMAGLSLVYGPCIP